MTTVTLLNAYSNDFQRHIPAEQLITLCAHLLGSSAAVDEIEELGGGLFNNTYHLKRANDADLILRVGPHPDVYVFSNETLLLRREYDISPAFASLKELIPQTIAVDFSHTFLNRDVMLQSFIPGELWDAVKDDLSQEENEQLWFELGVISAKIHAVNGRSFGQPAPMPSYQTWSESVIAIAEGMWQDLRTLKLDESGVAAYIDLLQQGRAFLDEIGVPSLLHGDLWPKNVLIDRTGSTPRITGLLDAERAMWGDPQAEWIYYFLEIPESYWQGNGRFPTTPAAQFRRHAYQGLYDIQIFLEAWRFAYADDFFRQQLSHACTQMSQLLNT